MQFTKYFSNLIKAKGVPHLSVGHYQEIFNIIILEARIDETNKLIRSTLNPDVQTKLNKRNYSLYAKYHNLIRDRSPEAIFKSFEDVF